MGTVGPVGSNKTYLVGQKEISTNIRLDKPISDWTNCPADGTNFLEDRKKHSTMCLKSNSNVYGLLSHLEQIYKIRAPSVSC